MALFQMIYMSSLITDEPEIVSAILESSVRNNQRRDVTGMMLCADGNVMQVLEGEQEAVLETFQSIQSDTRHHGIFLLIEGEIAARNFVSWSMGFRRISKADLEKFPFAAQVFKASQEEVSLRVQPSEALIILKSFAEDSLDVDGLH
jgi:signal transduction protein with GAF and PtsI domain